MFRTFEKIPLNACRPAATLTLLSLVILAAMVSPLAAQVAGDDWLLRISEKELQLAFADVPEEMKPIMWDVTFERNNYFRNMPTLELANLGAANAPDITRIQMTIGDTRFHFGDDTLGTAALQCPCHPSLMMLSEMVADGDTVDPRIRLSTPGITLTPTLSNNDNTLTINIAKQGGGGLAPGDLARFRIEIDPDAGFSHPNLYDFPDFRTVLFDINGNQVYGPDPSFPAGADDNARVTLTFEDNSTDGPVAFEDKTSSVPVAPLGELSGIAAAFFNRNFRAYGIMEPVDIFEIGDGAVIPEPGSAVLALIGLWGGIGIVASRRPVR